MFITETSEYSAMNWLKEGWENLASFRVGLHGDSVDLNILNLIAVNLIFEYYLSHASP